MITLESMKKIINEFNNQRKFKIRFSPFLNELEDYMGYKIFIQGYEIWFLGSKFEDQYRRELPPELFITDEEFQKLNTDTLLNSAKHYIY